MNKLGIIISLLLLLFSAAPLAAQQQDEKTPKVYWHIDVDDQGNASTRVSLYADEYKIAPVAVKAGLTAGLQKALQCAPHGVNFHADKASYSYRADCRLPVVKGNLVIRALIRPDHMLQEVRKTGVDEMMISLSVPRLGYNRGLPDSETSNRYDSKIRYQVDVNKEQKSVKDITLEFGYRAGALIRELALLSFFLTLPVLLILWLRKKTLAGADRDATAVWFGYWRAHRRIVEGTWLVWLIAVVSLRIDTFIEFVSGTDNTLIFMLIFIMPPVSVSLLCQYLARPVWLRVRGIDLDRRHMLAKGFWEHVATVAPLAFVIVGIISLFQDSGRAMLWFAVALVAKVVCSWMYGKVSGSMPRPLHGGDLKERVLDLARQAGVRINQVFIMPAQLYQMGNAFAMRGGNVIITDYLLERLTKRETDCVMAHEIGHVKRRHTLILSWFSFLIIFMIINFVLQFSLNLLPSMLSDAVDADMNRIIQVSGWIEAYLFYPVTLLSAWLLLYFISRRCERSADEFATLVTGDPENMIRVLAKLSRMNLLPLQWGLWDERLGTHPSAVRRCEAIAHRHRIAPERLRELLEAQPVIENDNAYAVPDEVSNPSLIFSTEFKTQKTMVIWLLLTFAIAITPLVTGHLVNAAGLPSMAYLAGIVITPVIYLLAVNYTSLFGYGKLKRRMGDRFAKEGIDLGGSHVVFVGIAPEEYPRSYENHTVWDIGFLIMGEKEMAYYGDRIRFKVPRENIRSVAKGARYPGWFDVPEIYIRWMDGDMERTFHLHSLNGNSMVAIARRSKELLRALFDWHQGRLSGGQSVVTEPSLGMPLFPDVKGNHPHRTSTVKAFVISVLFLAMVVFGLASLFQLEDFLKWYGAAIGAVCLFLAHLPVMRYRESN
jgi:Zn-dependent protease with chaperone function